MCVSRMTSSPLSGALLVHTMSFVFCSLPAFLVCEYVLQYWSRCSRCPLQQRFPTQRSWLWRVDHCHKCIAHLSVTLGSLGSWGVFLFRRSVRGGVCFSFSRGVLSFSVRLSQRHVRASPLMAGTLERASLMPGRQGTFTALSNLSAL